MLTVLQTKLATICPKVGSVRIRDRPAWKLSDGDGVDLLRVDVTELNVRGSDSLPLPSSVGRNHPRSCSPQLHKPIFQL
jgi:hypothetical protein